MEKIIHKEGYVKSFDRTKIHWELTAPLSSVEMEESRRSIKNIPLAIVMCDGIGCNHWTWKYFRRHFRDQYPLINWYLRGHGLSEAPHNLNHLTIKDLAKDLYAVIKALKVERAVLIGFSMSVQLIFEFYKMHPECVAGLIPLLGTYKNPLNTFLNSNVLKYLFPYMHKHFQEKERLWRVVWKLVFKAPFFFSLGKSLGLVHEISKRADLQPYFDHLANIDLRVFLQMVEFMDEHSAEDVLPNIKVPTLLIGAEKDSFTPFYIMEEMHRFIPDSQLLKVPLASHGAAVEFPELINLRIEKFLKHLKGHPQKIQKAIRRITRKAKGQDSSVSPKGSPFPNL